MCCSIIKRRTTLPQTSQGLWIEVKTPEHYAYDRLQDDARRLANDWSVGTIHALFRSQVPLSANGLDYATALESLLYARLLPEATACLKLGKVIETEHARPVVIATSSRLRARLFYRMLSDREIAHRIVVRASGPPYNDPATPLRLFWRPVRDLVRALALKRGPLSLGAESTEILIPEITSQTAGPVAGLLAELRRRGLAAKVLGVKTHGALWETFRRDFTADAKDTIRLHRFLSSFWWRAAKMCAVDVSGEVVLPFKLSRALAGNMLYEIAVDTEILKRSVRALRPRLLLYTTRKAVGGVTYSVGRHLGVPTMWLQLTELMRLERLAGIRADRLMVLGQAYKDRLVAAGVPAELVVVTGSDHCVPTPGIGREEARTRVERDLGLSLSGVDEKLVIFASQVPNRESNPTSYRQLVLGSIAAAVARLPNVRLVVKLHPRDHHDDAKYLNSGTDIEDRLAIIRDYPIDTLLEASDAVVVQWSTVGLQAIARQKPVLVVHYTGGAPQVAWASEGAAIQVDHPDKFFQMLSAVLWDESTREALRQNGPEFLERYLFMNDGRAWERLADAICELSRASLREEQRPSFDPSDSDISEDGAPNSTSCMDLPMETSVQSSSVADPLA